MNFFKIIASDSKSSYGRYNSFGFHYDFKCPDKKCQYLRQIFGLNDEPPKENCSHPNAGSRVIIGGMCSCPRKGML